MNTTPPTSGPFTRLRHAVGRALLGLAAKSAGERQFARFAGGWGFGGGGAGSYAGWGGDPREQVLHYKHWVKAAIDAVGSKVAEEPPLVARVHDGGPAAKALRKSGRLLTKGQVRKSLTPTAGHESLEPLGSTHPLTALLRRPNDFDQGGDFYRKINLFLELTGRAHVWVVKDRQGRPRELWVIPSHWVWPRSTGTRRIVEWYDVYPYGAGASTGTGSVRFEAEDVITLKYPSPLSDLVGYAPLQAGAETVDLYESTQMARWYGQKNSANVGSVLELPAGDMDPTDADVKRFDAQWMSRFAGERGFERPVVLPAGVKLVPPPPERELSFVTSTDQLRDYILALWHVPKSVVGILQDVNRAAFVGALAAFFYLCVNPRKRYYGRVLTEALAVPYFGEDLRVYWPDSTPSDPDAERADLDMLARNGSITPNELRGHYGYEDYGAGGDDPLVQLGISPLPLNTGDPDEPMLSEAAVADVNTRRSPRHHAGGGPGDGDAPDDAPGGIEGDTDVGDQKAWGRKGVGPHTFSSTQIQIADAGYSRSQGSPLERLGRMALAIPDHDLAADGREADDLHVTVKYGLHTDDPEAVRRVVEGFGPVVLRLGETSLFRRRDGGDKDYDVVKVGVESDDLRRLNRLVGGKLAATDAHPTYNPHVTLAYVKPGRGDGHAGDASVKGFVLIADAIVFSDPSGRRTTIPLLAADPAKAWNRLASAVGVNGHHKDFRESDHPRAADGKFGSGGGSATASAPKTDEARAAHVHRWSDRARALPAKVYARARAKVQGTYAKLEGRYGKKMAIAIMAAGVAGVPLPAPGASLATAAPVILVAELVRYFHGSKAADTEHDDLSDEDIESIAREWMEGLLAEWADESGSDTDEGQ